MDEFYLRHCLSDIETPAGSPCDAPSQQNGVREGLPQCHINEP